MLQLRTLVSFAISIMFVYCVLHGVDHQFLFDGYIELTVVVVSFIVFAIIVWKDKRLYEASRQYRSFTPTFIGLAAIVVVVISLYFLSLRDRSPVRLKFVSKVVDFNGVGVDFREDGTYKITEWCLGADYYRGTYTIADSIITVDNAAANLLGSDKFIIHTDGKKDSSGKLILSIYEINAHGESEPSDLEIVDRRP